MLTEVRQRAHLARLGEAAKPEGEAAHPRLLLLLLSLSIILLIYRAGRLLVVVRV
jgi:hypothetical protein